MLTKRFHWHGVWMADNLSVKDCRVDWAEVRRDSVVLITASEYGRQDAPKGTLERFVGSARIKIACVAPQDGYVLFRIIVDWPGGGGGAFPFDLGLPAHAPLPVVTDITLLDGPVVAVLHEQVG
jgi:hypothetical protein